MPSTYTQDTRIGELKTPLGSNKLVLTRFTGTEGLSELFDFQIEITTYRSEAYDRNSRKPEVSYGDTIEEDLVRRDFTVNAMAVALPEVVFVDPHHGHVRVTAHLASPASARASLT